MTLFRIGSGAGYSGDRIDPAQDLAERGALDALVFECLAERTIALAQLRKAQDPQQGYDPLLEERMRAVLPACMKQGIKVITNMGAANPLAAGQTQGWWTCPRWPRSVFRWPRSGPTVMPWSPSWRARAGVSIA
jgi:hypothetical protein